MGARKEIEELIAKHDDDRELAGALMQFSRVNWGFGAEAKWWGPLLYRRNREVFTPLIERWVNPWSMRGVKNIEDWMAEADANGDLRLWRGLYHSWLSGKFGWGEAAKRWEKDLLEGFQTAANRGDRRDVLLKYDIWYEIEDEFAAQLYAADPVLTSELLLRRIDRSQWWDIIYEKTANLAREQGDDELYFELYRRTFPQDVWTKDVLDLADAVPDSVTLCGELARRHLSGPDGAVQPATLLKLVEKRGADVAPYLERYIADVQTWGSNNDWKKLADVARSHGLHNVWAITVRSQLSPDQFSAEVKRLCSNGSDWESAGRLAQIAGAKHGWGAWRRFTAIDERVAVVLYDTFPEICRASMGPHLVVSAQTPYLELAKRAAAAGDDAMVDMLAARATVVRPGWYARGPLSNLNWYAELYDELDDEEFAERGVNVLGLIESPGDHWGNARLRAENSVYQVFFDDVERYASRLESVRDLLEAPYEDARRVGMRMIADAGSRGVDVAVRNADHLASYLLNESSRGTRIAALEGLAIAASHSRLVADDVLFRARAALDLRRKRYPRDRVIELVGRIIHRWPELQTAREHGIIFGAEAAW